MKTQPTDQGTILVVDDTPSVIDVTRSVLEEIGYRVVVATNGEKALQRAAAVTPDLILLDIMMPSIDGYETCRRLKAQEATREIPVLLLSALTDVSNKVKGFELGAVDYLTKPISPEELLARVRTHVTLSRLQRELRAANQSLEERVAARTEELSLANTALQQEIVERKRAEEALHKLTEELEERVKARTAELQASNKELAAVNNELETFSYSVSHDLRTPLRAIDGFSRILLEDYAESLDAEGRHTLERVCAASQRMGRLIDDLLMLAKVTRSEIRRAPVDLSELAVAITGELQKTDPGRRVEIVIAPGQVAQADATLMRSVLENLLGNAWKFTGTQSAARIEFGRMTGEGAPAYFVRDNGVGFDMTYAQKLFGAFQRFHTVAEFPGTGIGLATVQRAIRRHGGEVRAESEVNRGATFYFTLPDGR
ncbi:MAG: response regulator [Luteolibacter sp.]